MLISSTQNPKIKDAMRLQNRRERDETGLFLIEGYRELKRAVDSGTVHFEQLFICPEFFLGSNEQDLINKVETEIYTCSQAVFSKLSYRDRPDGMIGIAHQMRHTLPSLFPRIAKTKVPFLLVAEAIEKPGNLGTILRSADAVGIDGVIVCDKCTDIYNPNVVRASVGTLFAIPVVEATSAETLIWLQEKNIKVVAATPSADVTFTEADFTEPLAIVVGTEQLGLSEAWMQSADIRVSIPMNGVADSLNVGAATTLLLYEVLRQRRPYVPDISLLR
ncbi:MAG: RNA methyltransferase [Chlamydiota bacterium]